MTTLLRAAGILSVMSILGNSQAVAQYRRTIEIPKQIVGALVNEDESVQKCIESSGGANKTFTTESVNLDKDKTSEIMVRATSPCVCAPKKCLNRIYRKTENGYELLFKADYAREIELQKYYTYGHRSLWAAVTYQSDRLTSVLYEYQYDGKQYQWDHCLMRFYVFADWRKGVRGRVRYHSRPQISYVGCDPNNP